MYNRRAVAGTPPGLTGKRYGKSKVEETATGRGLVRNRDKPT